MVSTSAHFISWAWAGKDRVKSASKLNAMNGNPFKHLSVGEGRDKVVLKAVNLFQNTKSYCFWAAKQT
jgi:hypothetical protein